VHLRAVVEAIALAMRSASMTILLARSIAELISGAVKLLESLRFLPALRTSGVGGTA
jgi:hypothetical protein